MLKIKTFNTIAHVGLDKLTQAGAEVSPDLDSPDGLLLRSENLHAYSFNPTLKAVARAGAGVNNIPVQQLSELGIPVFNTPGANANAVKELVLAGMLIAARNITQAWQFSENIEGDDKQLHESVESGKKQFRGFELPSKTLAVIGLGAIGVKVANAALALGMQVIGYDPNICVQRAWELSADVKKAQSITEALTHADFISIHVPLFDETKHLVNYNTLQAMKPGVVILNFARGPIVDETALRKAIDENIVSHYVCDFPSNTLKDHPKIIALPHLGASTIQAEENCASMAAEQLLDYLYDGTLHNSVNFPEIYLNRKTDFRFSITNRNVPNMVGQISTHLAKAGLNIIDMINKSRGDIAYTLIDTDKAIPTSVQKAVASIEGVLKINELPQKAIYNR